MMTNRQLSSCDWNLGRRLSGSLLNRPYGYLSYHVSVASVPMWRRIYSTSSGRPDGWDGFGAFTSVGSDDAPADVAEASYV